MRLFLIFTSLLFVKISFSQENKAKEILTKMLTASDNMKGAKYTLYKHERDKDKIEDSEIIVKLTVSPFKIYVYSVNPNVGAEVLFIKRENNGDALVNPNKFPYINLNMNPYNSLLRGNDHHTILDMGFSYITSVLKNYMATYKDDFYKLLYYEGEEEFDGKKFYKLRIENNKFAYTTYIVQNGENSTSIAKKLSVSEYMISALNSDEIKAGQKIKIPNSYAKKIILLIDEINFLPLVQAVYDDKGLFEKYDHKSFILNPKFDPEEFTPKYKDYKF